MATKDHQLTQSDSEIAVEMLKCKLVSEAQLKAAIDYQESLGGNLVDVLLKLGLVKEEPLRKFLAAREQGEAGASGGANLEIEVDKLKVHKKLVEKVPAEIVEEFGVLLFFPPKGTRAILLSSSENSPSNMAKKLSNLLGVEIQGIDLEEEHRAAFLEGKTPDSAKVKASKSAKPAEESGEVRGETKARSPADKAESDGAPQVASPSGQESRSRPAASKDAVSEDQIMVKALINLLVKKQLVSKEELSVELELARRS